MCLSHCWYIRSIFNHGQCLEVTTWKFIDESTKLKRFCCGSRDIFSLWFRDVANSKLVNCHFFLSFFCCSGWLFGYNEGSIGKFQYWIYHQIGSEIFLMRNWRILHVNSVSTYLPTEPSWTVVDHLLSNDILLGSCKEECLQSEWWLDCGNIRYTLGCWRVLCLWKCWDFDLWILYISRIATFALFWFVTPDAVMRPFARRGEARRSVAMRDGVICWAISLLR